MREINNWLIDAALSLGEGICEIARREPKGENLREAQECLRVLCEFAQRARDIVVTGRGLGRLGQLYDELHAAVRRLPLEEPI